MMHSTYFIYGLYGVKHMVKDHSNSEKKSLYGKEGGNVLFNDTFNIFHLRLYGVKHMVKDHSNNKKQNPLPPLH